MHYDCSISKSNDQHHHHRHCNLIIVQICKRFRGVAQLSWVKKLTRHLQFGNYVPFCHKCVFIGTTWLWSNSNHICNQNNLVSKVDIVATAAPLPGCPATTTVSRLALAMLVKLLCQIGWLSKVINKTTTTVAVLKRLNFLFLSANSHFKC